MKHIPTHTYTPNLSIVEYFSGYFLLFLSFFLIFSLKKKGEWGNERVHWKMKTNITLIFPLIFVFVFIVIISQGRVSLRSQ